MPELPEVETVRRGLVGSIKDARISEVEIRFPTLRFPIPHELAEVMPGLLIKDITRRSKYLLWQLSEGYVLLSHLGMSGRYNLYATAPELYKKHEHVIWYLEDGRALAYEDPRRFGMLDLIAPGEVYTHPLLSELGPEPLSKAFNVDYFKKTLSLRKQGIKPVLMDAKIVVGVGNIYASEACYRAGILPDTPAASVAVDEAKVKHLLTAIKQVLKEAIDSGGSSLRDFWHLEGGGGYFQHQFFVYGRAGKPCLTCSAPIEQMTQAGRSTFYCPTCQV